MHANLSQLTALVALLALHSTQFRTSTVWATEVAAPAQPLYAPAAPGVYEQYLQEQHTALHGRRPQRKKGAPQIHKRCACPTRMTRSVSVSSANDGQKTSRTDSAGRSDRQQESASSKSRLRDSGIGVTRTVTKISTKTVTVPATTKGNRESSHPTSKGDSPKQPRTFTSTKTLVLTAARTLTKTIKRPSSSSSKISSLSASTGSTKATASTTTATSPAPSYKCPAGSHYGTFVDDFHRADTAKWIRMDGGTSSVSYGSDGLKMVLSPDVQNIVFQSRQKWIAPVTMSVSMRTTNAPGIIHCAIFKNEDASDEIDLELIEGGWDVPMWKDAKRLEFGRDVTGQLAASSVNHTAWKYYDKSAIPYDKIHKWTVNWNTTSLSWSADGKRLIDIDKLSGSKMWPSEPLHVRFGPWVGGDWAGKVNWTAHPHPVQQISRIEIQGCVFEQ